MSRPPVPTTLLVGHLGVGKTTAIQALLRHRPSDEHWAVLVNEFGEIGIDAAITGEMPGLSLREVPGGCLCCVNALPLQVALTELLRRARPDRLLIEPSGLGHPAQLVDLLRTPPLANALAPRAVIGLVDPRQWGTPVAQEPIYQDQVALADVLVASKTDLASTAQLSAFREAAQALYPPKLTVGESRHGALDPSWLDLGIGTREALHGELHAHHHHHRPSQRHWDPATGLLRLRSNGPDGDSCGWWLGPEVSFQVRRLQALFEHIATHVPAIVRLKGVLRSGRDWHLWQMAGDGVERQASAHRRDNRLSCIARAGSAVDWEDLERRLLAARLAL